MKPPVDEAPTKEELEVARILCDFPKLVLEAESRRLPDFLRWRVRRRRSALDDGSSLLDPPPPPPPPPPPSISPPPDGNGERKDGDAGGGATSSPATPLSFPASGSDEHDGRPPRPPCSLPAKKFKRTNRHMESIAEYQALYQKLKQKNSWLQDLQSKAVRESMAEEGQSQRQRQRQDGSSGLAPLGPTTLQSSATRYVVDPRSQHTEIQPRPADRLAGAGTPSLSVVALDLNASPQKEEDEWERSSAYKAAIAAQARKRRLEIQREKNNNCSSSPPSALFSMAHKMPRLR
uniref:Bromodomain testis-specific protein isoform X2 n=1 Tax=Elaeis guineensis var. tenera TaxID=51953 RepID=A0A6I9RZD4_ELAGV|nr:bromodomain testis-specific protein isoform X2 [Elaeis guineensis]